MTLVCRTANDAWCPWLLRGLTKARAGAAGSAVSFGSFDAQQLSALIRGSSGAEGVLLKILTPQPRLAIGRGAKSFHGRR